MKVAFRSIRSSGLGLGCSFLYSGSTFIPLTPSCRPSSSAAASKRRPTRQGHPFNLAVVGSGPAGFYTAHRVMAKIREAKVDMYEELPVPFGLVRFGVTPDYYREAKGSAVLLSAPGKCQAKFEEIASSPNFTFVGNVSVGGRSNGRADGVEVSLPLLLRYYDAVVFAYGAARDRLLGIPGESTMRGIYSAHQTVAWCNGLPGHAALAPDLCCSKDAIVIGLGDAALDLARILLTPIEALRTTHITERALVELARSQIRSVSIVGCRGPMQAVFTIKKVRELMQLPRVWFGRVDESLIPPDLAALAKAPKRLMEILLKGSVEKPYATVGAKSWSLDFCLSPVAFMGSGPPPHSLSDTVFEQMTLADPFDPQARAEKTGDMICLGSPVVFRAIGRKAIALDGFEAVGIPFDEDRGIIHNDCIGRVLREVRTPGAAVARDAFPGLYCAGSVKTGVSGMIASTMADAFATADAIAGDWGAGLPFLADAVAEGGSRDGWASIAPEIASNARVVMWDDWLKIDAAEKARGKLVGKEREKFTSISDMLEVLA